MALFNSSSRAVSAVCQEIADSVGASADSEMTARSGRSLNAALTYFNSRANWEYLLSEASPISVVAPFSVSINGTSGAASATAGASHGVKVDDFIVGSGFSVGTRVSATAAAAIGFNAALTATVSATVSAYRDMYDLPADWKTVYSVRTLGNNRALRLFRRRAWDRTVGDEFTTSTPDWYDIFAIGAKGKIRLLPPPAASDSLQLRYYRRMTIPTTTATAEAIDIPQDYEGYLIAWAKWHFLVDKSEGRSEQATVWLSMANEGITTMMKDQTRIPDEDLGFTPGHYGGFGNIDSSRSVPWEYS